MLLIIAVKIVFVALCVWLCIRGIKRMLAGDMTFCIMHMALLSSAMFAPFAKPFDDAVLQTVIVLMVVALTVALESYLPPYLQKRQLERREKRERSTDSSPEMLIKDFAK